MKKKCWKTILFLTLLFYASTSLSVPPQSGEVGFQDGVFSLISNDKNFEMKIGGRFQLRYWYAYPDENYPYIVWEETSTFEVYQARFFIWGNAFNPKWKYKLQLDFAKTTPLVDAYIDYNYTDYLNLTMGRFKVPFTRQKLASGTVLLFPRRSISNDVMNLGRDIGLMMWGGLWDNRFVYSVGVFNGDGEDSKLNNGKLKMYVGRVVFQPFGELSLDEARFKIGNGLKLAIGTSYSYNEPPASDLNNDNDPENALDTRWGVEVAAEWKRLFFAGEANWKFYNIDYPEKHGIESFGWYTQSGVIIIPAKLQLGVRYSWLDPNIDNNNTDGSDADIAEEFTLGLNYCIHSVRLFLQGSYSLLLKDYKDYPDVVTSGPYEIDTAIEQRVIIQLQIII